MDYLARVIVGFVSLLQDLITLWSNGQGSVSANVAAQAQPQIGDSLSSIFANGWNFIAELAAEVLGQMSNTVS